MKTQVKSLRSLSNRKRFDAMLNTGLKQVQQVTPEDEGEELKDCTEWIEDVKDPFKICDYCATKMMKSQENVRYALNNLQVQKTPECISHLNKFELALM